jgi:hypothetical protein
MATKLKKEDFYKYNTEGFKIGDVVYIPDDGIQAEIVAVDLDRSCMYNVMIDAKQTKLNYISVLIKDLYSDTVYYRKKALRDKYDVWIDSANIQHVGVMTEDIVNERYRCGRCCSKE